MTRVSSENAHSDAYWLLALQNLSNAKAIESAIRAPCQGEVPFHVEQHLVLRLPQLYLFCWCFVCCHTPFDELINVYPDRYHWTLLKKTLTFFRIHCLELVSNLTCLVKLLNLHAELHTDNKVTSRIRQPSSCAMCHVTVTDSAVAMVMPSRLHHASSAGNIKAVGCGQAVVKDDGHGRWPGTVAVAITPPNARALDFRAQTPPAEQGDACNSTEKRLSGLRAGEQLMGNRPPTHRPD